MYSVNYKLLYSFAFSSIDFLLFYFEFNNFLFSIPAFVCECLFHVFFNTIWLIKLFIFTSLNPRIHPHGSRTYYTIQLYFETYHTASSISNQAQNNDWKDITITHIKETKNFFVLILIRKNETFKIVFISQYLIQRYFIKSK